MNKIFLKKIGKNVQLNRIEKGFSQEYVAEKLGISRNAFGMIERGESNTSIGRLYQIYKILGIDLGDIITSLKS